MVRNVSADIHVGSDVDALILQTVAQVCGVPQATIQRGSDTVVPQGRVTIVNDYCGNVEVRSCGLVGTVRLLAPPELPVDAVTESWMAKVDQTVLSAVRSKKSDLDFFKAAVVELGTLIGNTVKSDCLNGTSLSLADAVVALSLGCVNVDGLPNTTVQYVTTILKKLYEVTGNEALSELQKNLKGSGGGSKAAPAAASSTDAASDNKILQLLQQHQIPYEHYTHELCMTADELVEKVKLPSQAHTHTKNLFFKDKKHGFFLITHATSTAVNTKQLGKQIGLTGKVNLRLADAQLLDDVLGVQPGCVGPLAIALATQEVQFVLDQALLDFEGIHSHPLYNDQSVKLTPSALQEFFSKVGVEPIVVDFSKAPAPAPAKGGGGKQTAVVEKKKAQKGETLLALQVKKSENFPLWYTDVITLSEMISYYDISGCYILRPWSYKMWELIQVWFNEKIGELGVENAYFPMFVSKDRLEKEKDHVEGFAPEVAWVTKSGDGDLAKPIAVRPTSETIMYPAYSDWIKSHRDLPLKLNQWSNVVRWEFKYPTPFLRTREFLWQEGHTAHASFEDADEMVMQALELYRGVYEDLLAVPVVPGYKTEKEKFAGGFRTTTVEAYIAGSGRAIQGATSHNLGQNFGKMFDIRYQDEKGEPQIPWQTSWGLTTRTIGVMVMVHGDDTGLVLPPRVAPVQVVIVPIVSKNLKPEVANPYCLDILKDLEASGIRTKFDDRIIYNPGWKYNHWEQKGVPIRIEVGPKDMEKKSARVVMRYNGEKMDMSTDGLGKALAEKLNEIQKNMFTKAKEARDTHMVSVTDWKDFVPNLEKNNLVLTPWIGGDNMEWEEWVKTKSREESLALSGLQDEDEKTATSVAAKTLCIPFEQPELPAGTKCIASGEVATCWVLWGRSY